MELTSVELHPALSSETAVLSFRDPRNINPYNVKMISGLDADEIVPRYYPGAPGENNNYYNLALSKREVVVNVGLNPRYNQGESFSSLRDDLYRLIASSRNGTLQLQFKNGETVIAAISGFVTKVDSDLMVKAPTVQISIRCDQPMLSALSRTSVNVSGLSKTNAIITDALSTAPHGFQFTILFIDDVSSFVMKDPSISSWEFEIVPVGGFDSGDILNFSSEVGNKYVFYTRGLDSVQLADRVTPGSVWPILFPGANHLAVESPSDMNWGSISYLATYWGV